MQRVSCPDPAPGDSRDPCRLPHGRLRCRGDRHLRREPSGPGGVRPGGSNLRDQPDRGETGSRGRGRLHDAGASPVRGGLDGSGHASAVPGADRLGRAGLHVRGAGSGPPGRRRARAPDRDLPGPPAGQGGDRGLPRLHAGVRCRRPPHGPGDDGEDRDHAPGDRDRRGPHRARALRSGRDRAELRHGPPRR